MTNKNWKRLKQRLLVFFLSIPLAYLNLYKVSFIFRVVIALQQKKKNEKRENYKKVKKNCYGSRVIHLRSRVRNKTPESPQ